MLVTVIHSVTQAPTSSSTALANSSQTSENQSKKKGLSGGAIAGIVIGVVVGVALIVGLLTLLCFGLPCLAIAPLLASRRDDDDDDMESQINEKHGHRDDVFSAIMPPPVTNNKHMSIAKRMSDVGLTYLLPDDISMNGKRRFSAGSLPDAANGSASDDSKSHTAGGLRVLNPDLVSSDEEDGPLGPPRGG